MEEVICKKCGKIFVPAPQHMYRDGKGLYCSWTCYNHRNDGNHQKRAFKYVEVYDKNDGHLLRRFTSATDAAEYTGFDIKKIQQACRNKSEYYGFVWKYKE